MIGQKLILLLEFLRNLSDLRGDHSQRAKSTGGFNHPDGSPCKLFTVISACCWEVDLAAAADSEGDVLVAAGLEHEVAVVYEDAGPTIGSTVMVKHYKGLQLVRCLVSCSSENYRVTCQNGKNIPLT